MLWSLQGPYALSIQHKDLSISAGMDIDQSFHAPANGALHADGPSWASSRRTDKTNGKDNDANSLQVDLYLKRGDQTYLTEAMELRRRTMIDKGEILSYFVADTFFLILPLWILLAIQLDEQG